MLCLVDGGGVEPLARATRPASCCAWSSWPGSIALRAGGELHQVELLRFLPSAELLPLVLRLVDRGGVELLASATRRASCCTWSSRSRSIALRVGVDLHQAKLRRGLPRAELLPLVLRLIDAAGVELVAVELLSQGVEIDRPGAICGGADIGIAYYSARFRGR